MIFNQVFATLQITKTIRASEHATIMPRHWFVSTTLSLNTTTHSLRRVADVHSTNQNAHSLTALQLTECHVD